MDIIEQGPYTAEAFSVAGDGETDTTRVNARLAVQMIGMDPKDPSDSATMTVKVKVTKGAGNVNGEMTVEVDMIGSIEME